MAPPNPFRVLKASRFCTLCLLSLPSCPVQFGLRRVLQNICNACVCVGTSRLTFHLRHCLKERPKRTLFPRCLSSLCSKNSTVTPSRHSLYHHFVSAMLSLIICLLSQDFAVKNETKKYILTKLPRYLIVHLKRFTKNNWFMEKNPTIVNFPVKNLQMRECITC